MLVALTTLVPVSTANAASEVCDSYLTAEGARGKCLKNGTLMKFKVLLKCENESWNPFQRGDTKMVASSWGYFGETRTVTCGGNPSSWKPIWTNIMTGS